VDFEGRLVKLSELKELAQLNSEEALVGPAEDVSANLSAENDINQSGYSLYKEIASNNELIAGNPTALIETENQSKQQLNQTEAASKELLDAGLCDNLTEKEDPVMGDSGRSVPEEKQVMDAEIEAAGMGEDKHSAAERKTNNKKVSSKTKAK